MKSTMEGKNQQDQSNQTNKGDEPFVRVFEEETKRFKYKFSHTLSKYKNERLIALKNACNKIRGIVQLRLDKFDFKAARGAVFMWLMNAFVEGVIVNFAVWGLLGWKFSFITIMAWGCAVKQILDFYWRLKINGTTTKLPEKHE